MPPDEGIIAEQPCTVEIGVETAVARLSVTDNGAGGSFSEGNGLAGMRQRLRAAGGSLALRPAEPGTHLVATVPIAT